MDKLPGKDVVLVPAYNEEGTIREIVSKTRKHSLIPIRVRKKDRGACHKTKV
jgi:hypothetical protein